MTDQTQLEQSNTGEERLTAIEDLVRLIVNLDMPDVSEDSREVLIQHLTGALFVRTDQWCSS